MIIISVYLPGSFIQEYQNIVHIVFIQYNLYIFIYCFRIPLQNVFYSIEFKLLCLK